MSCGVIQPPRTAFNVPTRAIPSFDTSGSLIDSEFGCHSSGTPSGTVIGKSIVDFACEKPPTTSAVGTGPSVACPPGANDTLLP